MSEAAESPLETYLAWFEGLAPELARDLAVSLMQLFPGDLLTSSLITGDPTDGLTARIRRLAPHPAKATGLVASLAALTDLAFLERADPERADRTRAMLDVIDEAQDSLSSGNPDLSGEVEQWVADQQLRHPLRIKLWARAAPSWQALRDGPLADARLLDDMRRRMMGL